MTPELDSTRAVRAWLEDGVTRLPDRVLDSVLAELPSTPQRPRSMWTDVRSLRRSTWVRLLVALMVLAIIGSSLAIASGAWRLMPIPRAIDSRALEAGRWVIDEPFPVHISLDLPSGWKGDEIAGDVVRIAHDDSSTFPASMFFTLVEAIYPDPCHFDAVSIVEVGPGVDDLSDGLATLKGVDVTPPREVVLGGYPARTLALTAPASTVGCSSRTDAPFRIWGLPELHWLAEGERNQVWVTQVGGTRLVVATEVFPDTPSRIEAELEAMVASVRLGEHAAIAVPTSPAPASPLPSPEPTIAPLPIGWSVDDIAYVTHLTVYDFDTTGQVVPVDVLDAVFQGQSGWIATSRGIASDQGGPPDASLSWWNVGTVYRDPCHWATSAFDGPAPPVLQSNRGLSEILSAWADVPGTPAVTKEPIASAWLGLVYLLELAIPGDLDPANCDGEQYRLWAEHDGTPRLGYPGEQIKLATVDFEPGLLVVDTSWRREASVVARGQAQAARDSLWIGRARESTPSPATDPQP